jgi:dCMP deaminase
MAVAREVARRATCPRAQVGCVLTAGGMVLATGYNGAPSKAAHCTDVGCWMVDGHCKRALHAELNAVMRLGDRRAEVAYVTHLPCLHCIQALHLAGVRRVVYAAAYRADADIMRQALEIYGVTLAQEVIE